ncbi:peroxisomal membrane anchor protein conserved region-domain-containing protein [Podospora didyma]|uniref:Peroxisomal membrane protein PEX14 n=1 Tax=Podospora didyma TaxID=330526 RepID=A0AAE0U1M1_9PEZI|nr:peroxisomal membrane anchor protein conserved region-domain-containing protein [Podospora didyma]
MSDTDKDEKSGAPSWQRAQPSPESKPTLKADEPQTASLERARKFLQDADVQKTTPERKAEFLKSKGIPERDIEELLKDEVRGASATSQAESRSLSTQITPPATPPAAIEEPLSESGTEPLKLEKRDDRPPIITYPEFLTKPARPPPLVTVNGFFNTLYAFGAVSALIYGASKYVVEPMVDALTEARISLHDTAKQDLDKLVAKLENTVSEIPPNKKTAEASGHTDADDDAASSSYDDPTELFHRDIGVQTSLPTSPLAGTFPDLALSTPEKPVAQQTRRLTELVASLKGVHEGTTSQTRAYMNITVDLDDLRTDLDRLGSAQNDWQPPAGFSFYGRSSRSEPDDEIKKAKENIRRVKGVLLSARSFPATTK